MGSKAQAVLLLNRPCGAAPHPVCPLLSPSICPFSPVSIHALTVHPHCQPPAHPSTHLSTLPSILQSFHSSICPHSHPSIHLPSTHLHLHLNLLTCSATCPPIYLPICPSFHPENCTSLLFWFCSVTQCGLELVAACLHHSHAGFTCMGHHAFFCFLISPPMCLFLHLTIHLSLLVLLSICLKGCILGPSLARPADH